MVEESDATAMHPDPWAASRSGATVALTENDWGATTIFGAIAAMLAFAGLRNFRALNDRDEPTSR